jgi:hypothetical protein
MRARLPQQQHVVGVDHRGVRRCAVRLPDRPAVEGGEAPRALCHVGEAAKPHEPVEIVEVAELADDLHPVLLLRLHEMGVEEVDQVVPAAGVERVLPKLDDRRHAGILPDHWPCEKIHRDGC